MYGITPLTNVHTYLNTVVIGYKNNIELGIWILSSKLDINSWLILSSNYNDKVQ